VLDAAFKELDNCDLCLVVGTSSVVYPAAMFAPQVSTFDLGLNGDGQQI
jgi:NAD-dependent deacetylase sirtuin 5